MNLEVFRMSTTHQPTLLVTGASGQLGRRVIELLVEAGAGNINAATRTPEKLADFTAKGVEVRQADFDNPASLDEAFAGVDRLLLISTDVAGEPGRRINQHLNAVKAAEKAGVKHVVYTSLINPGPESPVTLAVDHYSTENALEASTMGWTVLRENIYAEVLVPALNRAGQSGQLFSAIGDGKMAYITREDVAHAAAAALASDFSGRRTLDLTGPEALTQADLAAIASSITGKPVTYVPLPLEAMVQGMVSAGLPRPLAEGYASFDAAGAQGLFSQVSNAVEELTGRKPIRIVDFLTAQRDSLAQGAHPDPVELS
jgi:NAD(P)H dehydrogenase (quinone)